MTPTQEQVDIIKTHMLNMANYESKELRPALQNKIRQEIDKTRIWLMDYDTPQREENYHIEQKLRLWVALNFIYG